MMSYDISIYVGVARHEVWSRNITSNIGPMYDKALNGGWYDKTKNPLYESLNDWNNTPCPVVFEIAVRIVQAMKADPDAYRALNPLNGWGNYESALEYMEDLAANCERNPDGVVSLWR